MIEVRYLRKMIDGVPVMATPAEIDVTTAEQLRAVLLAATENRYRTPEVDMTRTRFCEDSGRRCDRRFPPDPAHPYIDASDLPE